MDRIGRLSFDWAWQLGASSGICGATEFGLSKSPTKAIASHDLADLVFAAIARAADVRHGLFSREVRRGDRQ